MSDSLTMKLVAAAEKEDWKVAWDYKDGWEFEKYSPAGEDFLFTVFPEEPKDVAREVREYARDFEPHEHAEMWVRSRGHVSGVPDIETLVDDAHDIKEMLEDLASAMRKAEEEYNDC